MPNPEAFAKTVLTELARIDADTCATRQRLYQLMQWMRYPQTIQQMESEDETHIENAQKKLLDVCLTRCGLNSGPTPPDNPPHIP